MTMAFYESQEVSKIADLLSPRQSISNNPKISLLEGIKFDKITNK
jgi:hypothetical protein